MKTFPSGFHQSTPSSCAGVHDDGARRIVQRRLSTEFKSPSKGSKRETNWSLPLGSGRMSNSTSTVTDRPNTRFGLRSRAGKTVLTGASGSTQRTTFDSRGFGPRQHPRLQGRLAGVSLRLQETGKPLHRPGMLAPGKGRRMKRRAKSVGLVFMARGTRCEEVASKAR